MAIADRKTYQPSDIMAEILNGTYVVPVHAASLVEKYKATARALNAELKKKHYAKEVVAKMFEILKNIDRTLSRCAQQKRVQFGAHVR